MKKAYYFLILRNATTLFDVMVFHTTLVIKGHYFFVEHQIDLKISGNNVMLKKYSMTVPCSSGDEQTVRKYVYFFKTSF